ncbi:MAG: hypothetical protein O2960_29910, partial [Verrucomicrobia bacterium]|nr:hypothetical protein [Verrucomicrobiota bacterium]
PLRGGRHPGSLRCAPSGQTPVQRQIKMTSATIKIGHWRQLDSGRYQWDAPALHAALAEGGVEGGVADRNPDRSQSGVARAPGRAHGQA